MLINIHSIVIYIEKHGIHRQKDLSKFYSNLLKNNISMGAYNVVKANDNDTDEQSKDSSAETSKGKDIEKQKERNSDEIKDDDVEKRRILKRPCDEDNQEEERTDREDEERDRTVEGVRQSTHVIEDKTDSSSSTVQEKISKKKVEKRNTEDTVMAARERYLARKRLKQDTQ